MAYKNTSVSNLMIIYLNKYFTKIVEAEFETKSTNLKVVPNRRDKYNECILRSRCKTKNSPASY